jgi:hypothetical protein
MVGSVCTLLRLKVIGYREVTPWVRNIVAACTQRTGAIRLTDTTIRVQGIESVAPVRIVPPESCVSEPLPRRTVFSL